MVPPQALGVAVKRVPGGLAVLFGAMLAAHGAAAGERYALIVSGASGGARYAENYDRWRTALVSVLRVKYGFPNDHLVVLAENPGDGIERSSRENVRKAIADLASRMAKEDVLLVVLIGHGTFDGIAAKFNLVGPDLDASEWGELFKRVPGRVVLVDTTAASFPFLQALAGSRNRVVITATDSPAQRYETVFPEFFIKALDDKAADLDKNGRVSIWEALQYASAGVKLWYEQHGQLATERALIDDNGDGIGQSLGAPGQDGALARTTYLEPEVSAAAAGDGSLAALQRRREGLEQQAETLKSRKSTMPPDQFEEEFEREKSSINRESPIGQSSINPQSPNRQSSILLRCPTNRPCAVPGGGTRKSL
jgi:hypothetical protein